jgi:hypothetical protein
MRSLGFWRQTHDLYVTALVALALAACGGASRRGGGGRAFECGGRHATYVVTGGIAAPEAGVKMSCDGNVPMVEEYRIDEGGHEHRRSERISADAWDDVWSDFEHGGWRMVEDCKNPGAGKKDPFYVFEVADDDQQISVTCKGKELPFPHDTFRDALDRARSEMSVDERAE